MGSELASYAAKLASGEMKPDAAQDAVAEGLARLAAALVRPAGGFLAKVFARPDAPPKGLYIHGPVGRGKTLLMDCFFADVELPRKRRVHFHAFMREVHARIHAERAAHSAHDALKQVACAIAGEARLLCLDEMQVSDITDAMIIGRLFEALFERGTVVVTTANLPPQGLYRDGLNRQLFLPFIALLERQMDVVSLAGPLDYRLNRIKGYETWVTPLGPAADAKVQTLWRRLTDTQTGQPAEIALLGRKLLVPQAARNAARFSFAALCEAPLGPADYLALIDAFNLIFVENIPVFGPADRNAVKRFILFIDTLHDRRGRLVASAAAIPQGLTPPEDHAFTFQRTVSRLAEMQSAAWWGGRIVDT